MTPRSGFRPSDSLGDVQLALGLNNAQMQAVAEDLQFTYNDTVEYDVPCVKETQRQIIRHTFNRERTVSGAVAYDARKRNQVNGFNLNGFEGQPIEDGNIACPDGFDQDGEPVLVGSSGGGLLVNGVALPSTPAL